MGQTYSFLPSLITSHNPSNASAPVHSKPSQQLNCPQEDLTEGSNSEQGSLRMGWAGEFMFIAVCYARSFVQGKVWPHYEAQELTQKAAL